MLDNFIHWLTLLKHDDNGQPYLDRPFSFIVREAKYRAFWDNLN